VSQPTILLPTLLLGYQFNEMISEMAYWPNDGSAYAGAAFQWSVNLTVLSQSHSAPNTPTPFAYTATDVKVGDWLSNAVGGFAWIIRSIDPASNTTTLICTIEDVGQFNTYSDPSNNGYGGMTSGSGFIFQVDESNQPILSPLTPNIITPEFQTDIMGRFAAVDPPVTTALLNFPTATTIASTASSLTMQNGSLEWVPSTLLGATYVFSQTTPATTWTINHNLNKFPNVDLVDVNGQLVEAEVDYVSANEVTVGFAIATAGTAYLN
jgi:hypothetical protein